MDSIICEQFFRLVSQTSMAFNRLPTSKVLPLSILKKRILHSLPLHGRHSLLSGGRRLPARQYIRAALTSLLQRCSEKETSPTRSHWRLSS